MSAYTLYGGELSLFTRKLEAAMNFYGAQFERQAKTADNASVLETRSGTHQVPVLATPENWMIADTTPIIAMLDARFPARALFPAGELGVLVHVLEEHFDEWIARVMVHYRWHYPDSARFAAERMASGDPLVVERMLNWGPRACRATGTESMHQREAVEAEYLRILEAAEHQLKQTAFLLGDRPSALDCMVLGGLRAHTYMDPDPKKVTSGFPTVIEWVEQRADNWRGDGALAAFPHSTEFAQHVLGEMAETYGPFVLANEQALNNQEKAFTAQTYGEEVSYLTRPYPQRSKEMVQARIAALTGEAHSQVASWLKQHRLEGVFLANPQ